jgi:hypothetical protein
MPMLKEQDNHLFRYTQYLIIIANTIWTRSTPCEDVPFVFFNLLRMNLISLVCPVLNFTERTNYMFLSFICANI